MTSQSRAKNRAAQAERSRATRSRVVAAATELFVREGYVRTTMADIAAAAGVAVQTLYLGFGGKGALLAAALDVAIVGDDEPVPVLERPWFTELRAEPDGPRALAVFVGAASEIIERNYPLYAAIRAAASDPDPAELLATDKRQRFATHSAVVAELATKTGFDSGLPVERAAQTVYALMSQETYGLLVAEHGWSRSEWAAWVERQLRCDLFPYAPQTAMVGSVGARR